MYWFRKAHDHLTADQRAGLVGTNSISQNRARGASLEYIATNGGVITDAVSTQKWPGEAGVARQPGELDQEAELHRQRIRARRQVVGGITPSCGSPSARPDSAQRLRLTSGRPSRAQSGSERFRHRSGRGRGASSRERGHVLRRWCGPTWVVRTNSRDPQKPRAAGSIDFGLMPLEAAMQYPAALDIVRERVKPSGRPTIARRIGETGGSSPSLVERCGWLLPGLGATSSGAAREALALRVGTAVDLPERPDQSIRVRR